MLCFKRINSIMHTIQVHVHVYNYIKYSFVEAWHVYALSCPGKLHVLALMECISISNRLPRRSRSYACILT